MQFDLSVISYLCFVKSCMRFLVVLFTLNFAGQLNKDDKQNGCCDGPLCS